MPLVTKTVLMLESLPPNISVSKPSPIIDKLSRLRLGFIFLSSL